MRKSDLRKYGFFLITLFFARNCLAQQQDSLTVERAIATALKNNFDIQLSRNDSLIAAINYSYRNAALLPTLNTNSTILFNNNAQSQSFENGTTKTRSGIKSGNTNAALGLNWVVFDGFKMFIIRNNSGQYLELGSLTIKNQVINSVSDVIKTYYDIVHQKQLLRNIEEQMALSSDRLKLAQYKFEVGTGIKPDVLQAQIDFNQQRAAQVNQFSTIDQRKQSLNQLMNVTQTTDYKVSDTIPLQTDLVLGDLLNNLTQSSPQLLLSQKNIDIAKVNVKVAKAELYPVIGVTTAYNFARTNNNAVINPTFQPLTSSNHGFNYGITASVPIFNNFTIRRQIKQAELTVTNQQLVYQNQQSVVNTNLLNAYKIYDAQKSIVVISDSSIRFARENLTIARERYRLGVTTFIELRQAEQSLADAETTLITARYNLKVAETELLRLKGDLLKQQ